MKYLLIVFASLLSLISLAQTQTQTDDSLQFSPAQFNDRPSSLNKRIAFPQKIINKKIYENVIIRCDALIEVTGKIGLNYCGDTGNNIKPYITSINLAVKGATIQPGKVNGITKRVWFQYYVVFMNSEKGHSVEAFPNSGLQLSQLGPDYTSAQRYQDAHGNFGAACGFNPKITVNAVIDKQGKAKSVAIKPESTGEKCKKYLIEAFMEQRFIPAFYQGQAIDSYYSELIFNNLRRD